MEYDINEASGMGELLWEDGTPVSDKDLADYGAGKSICHVEVRNGVMVSISIRNPRYAPLLESWTREDRDEK